MAGKLSDHQMDLLEASIGTGPKTFTLLYKITRDGCVAKTFHQKCDNVGPTVTVLYNLQNSVYGAYASGSWNSSGQHIKDNEAFLFQLQFSGDTKLNKFPCTNPQYALNCNGSFGPTFGYNFDFRTFTDTVNPLNGIFKLNGKFAPENAYEVFGVRASYINNDTMDVTELEVYKVADSPEALSRTPWRTVPELDKKYAGQLKEEIENAEPLSGTGISEYRFLMVGPIGSGKSSFYNTVDSIYRGRISHKALCGDQDHAITQAYAPYDVLTCSGSSLNFRLCDTPGLAPTGLMDVDYSYIVDGYVPDFYQFNRNDALTVEICDFVKQPSAGEKIHCAAFVLDASTLDKIPMMVTEKMRHLIKMFRMKSIPCAVILTKIDILSENIKKDVAKTFRCIKVEKVVNDVAKLLGVNRNSVLVVKNYEDEVVLNDGVNCLALIALQKLFHLVEDNLLNMRSKVRGSIASSRLQPEIGEIVESDTA